MGPNGASSRMDAQASTAELAKSLTFHDFCELTQRQLEQISIRKADAEEEITNAVWKPRQGRIEEEEAEEEEGGGQSGAVAPRWTTTVSTAVEDRESAADRPQSAQQQQAKRPTANKRRRPLLNATFSSWLQLFLAKRRHRHNRYLSGEGGTAGMMHQSTRCYGALAGPNGGPLRPSVSLSVVHEATALGSDGESIEVSPCTSDQSGGNGTGCGGGAGTLTTLAEDSIAGGHMATEYVPKVKLRHKANRRWTEQDIQKRLSLPPDIKLPQNVIDKLNRTPTLDNPLTRKSKRASLSEIGFGKLETYKKIFDLGEGTYATVYLGKSLLTGKNVALKEIRLEHEEGAPCTAIREVSLLRNLKHANIVTLHDIVYTDRTLTLVFEFLERDLREYMEELEGMLSLANVKLFLVQLLRGLAYCHSRRILHRDLKPQNLLINRTGELKLADFGLARAQSVPTKTYSNEVVTLWYRPPDVLLGSIDYSTHIDMWGVGCILYEMLMHKPMFPGSTTDEQLNLIFLKLGTPSPETHPELCALPNFSLPSPKGSSQGRSSAGKNGTKSLLNSPRITPERADLLHRLLRYEGKRRISALEAMRHPFLQCFPEQIFRLPDTESVLTLPNVRYVRESIRNDLFTSRPASGGTEKASCS